MKSQFEPEYSKDESDEEEEEYDDDFNDFLDKKNDQIESSSKNKAYEADFTPEKPRQKEKHKEV